jgi:AcrR family transcriptional regulator
MKRREMITLVSLELFNELGEANLTAVDIANELDISPGNLYYHYRGKEQIIAELYKQFEQKMKLAVTVEAGDEGLLHSGWLHLYVVMELLYAYRFFFRNLEDFYERYPDTGKKLARSLEVMAKAVYRWLKDLASAGELTITDKQLTVVRRLSESIIMVLVYWSNFRSAQGVTHTRDEFIEDAAMQLLSLLSPYLNEKQIVGIMGCHITYLKSLEG